MDAARLLARGELQTDPAEGETARARRHDELAASLAAFGLKLEVGADGAADEPEPFFLWPEHLPALELWAGVQTQWRAGAQGFTGLDYAGVRASPAFRRLAPRDRERVFGEVEVMERATLTAWAEMRAAERAPHHG